MFTGIEKKTPSSAFVQVRLLGSRKMAEICVFFILSSFNCTVSKRCFQNFLFYNFVPSLFFYYSLEMQHLGRIEPVCLPSPQYFFHLKFIFAF